LRASPAVCAEGSQERPVRIGLHNGGPTRLGPPPIDREATRGRPDPCRVLHVRRIDWGDAQAGGRPAAAKVRDIPVVRQFNLARKSIRGLKQAALERAAFDRLAYE